MLLIVHHKLLGYEQQSDGKISFMSSEGLYSYSVTYSIT